MNDTNINHTFLDGVLQGKYPDVYYHFGLSSADPVMESLKGVRAIVMAGSAERIRQFAADWSHQNSDTEIIAFTKEDRFVARYTAGILFASHGMGMPSASIALQELMRMVYFLKGGDLEALQEIFWARVGTSGGIGLPPGSVVVSSEGVMADMKPYRLLQGTTGTYWFNGDFPSDVREAILSANANAGYPVVTGRTVAGNEFFLEQFRLDGAICMESPESKSAWLELLHRNGVCNIEMEGAMFAGYLNHWGFDCFAMICCTLLDRLEGDQVTASPEELHEYAERAGQVLFNYLRSLS